MSSSSCITSTIGRVDTDCGRCSSKSILSRRERRLSVDIGVDGLLPGSSKFKSVLNLRDLRVLTAFAAKN